MSNSKYEIRSEDAQELMKMPPHFLSAWGNTIILAALVIAIALLGGIDLAQYNTVTGVISDQNVSGNCFELKLPLHKQPEDLIDKPLVVRYSRDINTVEETFNGKVIGVKKLDSLDYVVKVQSLNPSLPGGIAHLPDSGLICSARIYTGKASILTIIRKQFQSALAHY
jgi:hypothetical protein